MNFVTRVQSSRCQLAMELICDRRFARQFGSVEEDDLPALHVSSQLDMVVGGGFTKAGLFTANHGGGSLMKDIILIGLNATTGATIFTKQMGTNGDEDVKGIVLDPTRRGELLIEWHVEHG